MVRRTTLVRMLLVMLALLPAAGCTRGAEMPPTVGPSPSPARFTARPSATAAPTPVPATATPASRLKPGWSLYDRAADGFAIALPPAWRQIEMDSQTLETSLQVLRQENPEMAPLLEGQARSLIASGVRFYGFDLSPEAAASGFATNVNVLRQTLTPAVSLDVYVQLNVGQVETMPGVVKPVAHRRVKLPAGDAEQLQYSMQMAVDSGQTVMLTFVQYVIMAGSEVYVVTCTTTADQAPKYAQVFVDIGQSFSVTRPE